MTFPDTEDGTVNVTYDEAKPLELYRRYELGAAWSGDALYCILNRQEGSL